MLVGHSLSWQVSYHEVTFQYKKNKKFCDGNFVKNKSHFVSYDFKPVHSLFAVKHML